MNVRSNVKSTSATLLTLPFDRPIDDQGRDLEIVTD